MENIITNLRIPKDDYLQVKTEAAEMGFSLNEYLNFLIRDLSIRRRLDTVCRDNKNKNFWDLPKISGHKKGSRLEPEDTIIYESLR